MTDGPSLTSVHPNGLRSTGQDESEHVHSPLSTKHYQSTLRKSVGIWITESVRLVPLHHSLDRPDLTYSIKFVKLLGLSWRFNNLLVGGGQVQRQLLDIMWVGQLREGASCLHRDTMTDTCSLQSHTVLLHLWRAAGQTVTCSHSFFHFTSNIHFKIITDFLQKVSVKVILTFQISCSLSQQQISLNFNITSKWFFKNIFRSKLDTDVNRGASCYIIILQTLVTLLLWNTFM